MHKYFEILNLHIIKTNVFINEINKFSATLNIINLIYVK